MLIVTYAVAFFLELFQKDGASGAKKRKNSRAFVVFNVFLLAFNKHIYTHCIYKLISILQDVLIRSLFQRGEKQF